MASRGEVADCNQLNTPVITLAYCSLAERHGRLHGRGPEAPADELTNLNKNDKLVSVRQLNKLTD